MLYWKHGQNKSEGAAAHNPKKISSTFPYQQSEK